MARQFYYITIDLTVKLNDKERVNNPVSDRVSIRLSEYERNMNQKYFLKNTNFRWTFHGNIVRCLYFLEYS